jgi:hypothetical protein
VTSLETRTTIMFASMVGMWAVTMGAVLAALFLK